MHAEGGKIGEYLEPTPAVKGEARHLTTLAAPLILACLLNMGISITDVVMMNWLGTETLAAGAAASDYYSIVFHFCAGIIAALSPFISQSLGARKHDEVVDIFKHGLVLALVISVPGAFVLWHSPLLLSWIGVSRDVVLLSSGYAHMMSITFVFMLGVTACDNFLSAHQRTRVIYYVHIAALPLNALGNQVFMFGNAYVPQLGLAGAGLSSMIVAAVMFFVLLGYISLHSEFRQYRVFLKMPKPSCSRLLSLARVGLPIGVSRVSELGVYLLSTVLVGIFGAEQLAAHALALRLAGLLYAFPLGLAQAATVRAALAVGSADIAWFRRIAAVSMSVIVGMTLVNSLILVLLGDSVADYFFDDGEALSLAVTLLGFLVIVHPIHGVATVCNGLLRGKKDTHGPMWISVTAFWAVGFAGGCALAFHGQLGAVGIWIGLLAASTTYCAALLARFWLNNPKTEWAIIPLLSLPLAQRCTLHHVVWTAIHNLRAFRGRQDNAGEAPGG